MRIALENVHPMGLPWIDTVETYPSLPSTNTLARTRIQQQCPAGTVIRARRQTAGRGRQGRSWFGHTGSLTFSIVWPLRLALPEAVSLVIGIAAAETLAQWVPAVRVKWPNDLWIGHRKAGGMLGETVVVDGERWLIFGMGINVNGSYHLNEASNEAVSLEECVGRPLALDTVLARLLTQIDSTLTQYASGRRCLQDDLKHWGNFLNREVTVQDHRRHFVGIAEAVQADGSLLIRTAEGLVTLRAGDVSLRPSTSA